MCIFQQVLNRFQNRGCINLRFISEYISTKLKCRPFHNGRHLDGIIVSYFIIRIHIQHLTLLNRCSKVSESFNNWLGSEQCSRTQIKIFPN